MQSVHQVCDYFINMRVLVLGHGRLYIEQGETRCVPMALEEFEVLLRENDVMTVDIEEEVRPDVLLDLKTPWGADEVMGRYDMIVEAVSHLALDVRQQPSFWAGVHDALEDDGVYVGWGWCGQPGGSRRDVVRWTKADVLHRVTLCQSQLSA
jgi:hypothetical protein